MQTAEIYVCPVIRRSNTWTQKQIKGRGLQGWILCAENTYELNLNHGLNEEYRCIPSE
jgi:hypothetical protein